MFVIQVRGSTPHMDGKYPWVNTSAPMSGHQTLQAIAGMVRRYKQGMTPMEDYRIVLHNHTYDKCCYSCQHHVTPHRGCILR